MLTLAERRLKMAIINKPMTMMMFVLGTLSATQRTLSLATCQYGRTSSTMD